MCTRRALYALETADQWLALALDTIGALLSFLVSMLVVGRKGLLGASKSALILERVRPRLARPQFGVHADCRAPRACWAPASLP